MPPRVIVYEDPGWQRLLPLVYMRATFQLVCGTTDLVSRVRCLVEARPGHEGNGRSGEVEVWCRLLLAEVVSRQTGLPVNQPPAPPALLLNGRALWQSLPETNAGDAS